MVLEIQSHFPRLRRHSYCNAFDAKTLSDYPEEQEWLVGHCYVRLMNVYTRPLYVRTEEAQNGRLDMDNSPESLQDILQKVPLSSWLREEFLVIHLFREQIFTMSPHLAQMLAQYLRVCRKECCDLKIRKMYEQKYEDAPRLTLDWRGHELCAHAEDHQIVSKQQPMAINVDIDQQKAVRRWQQLTPVFWHKFDRFRRNQKNMRQRVRFDEISPILKRYFMEQIEDRDIDTNERKWIISFREITTIYPNVKELHFVNQYKFDDVVLAALIEQIQVVNNMVEKVVFQYFDYEQMDNDGVPLELDTGISFFDPRNLNGELVQELGSKLNWKLEYRRIGTGNGGYKITIYDRSRGVAAESPG